MKSLAHSSELLLLLEPARGELVRAFVREAALADDVPAAVASLLAEDTAEAWLTLCNLGTGRERARMVLVCSRAGRQSPHPAVRLRPFLQCRHGARRTPPARCRHLLP